ncbi:hypothetical protein ALC60_02222 [Trachymyrmex zeteki]|uniref:Uncharacterized protein n=1 Tax=Mycetomoellerius zeteki TaxID=64791 RepID=A0A151XDZ2_9HYME|nr:hypothetical protein ALC60_02222 [Trachymyrmex zeteki]
MERQAKKEAAGDDGNSRYALEDADGGKKESRGRGTKRDEMPGKCVANRRTETPFNVAGNPEHNNFSFFYYPFSFSLPLFFFLFVYCCALVLGEHDFTSRCARVCVCACVCTCVGTCTAPSSQHATLAIPVFSLLSVALGLLDTQPACDDKQSMDKSSRFTSETIAFATQLGDLHVRANAIGPRRSLPGAIYCYARNSCKRSCSSKTLHEFEAVGRVNDTQLFADKNIILPGEVNIGEESSRFVSFGTPLAMHFRGLHRTPDVIDLSQIGIRNHLARRPRLRLVIIVYVKLRVPTSRRFIHVDSVDVRGPSGRNFKVYYSWCTSDPAESLECAIDRLRSDTHFTFFMHEDVSIRQLLCKFFKNPFPCSDNCDGIHICVYVEMFTVLQLFCTTSIRFVYACARIAAMYDRA